MKNYIGSLLLPLLIIGCTNKQPGSYKKNRSKISIHHLTLEKSGLDLDFQCGYSSYSLFDDSTKIHYYYNQGEILIVNIDSDTKKRVVIPSKYQKELTLWNANIYNVNGKILLSTGTGNFFQVFDDGKLKQIADINANESMKKRKIYMNPTLGFTRNVSFLNEDEFIFTTLLKDKKTDRKLHHYPLFCKYSLKSNKVTCYNYYYRDSYFDYNRPVRSTILQSIVGDTLIVAYMYSGKVDLFSLSKNKLIGQKDLSSKYQTGEIDFLDDYYSDFEMERYDIEQPVFGEIFYNPMKKCYYRVFYHALPEKNKMDEYTIQQDKKASIAIFDKAFNWIGEVDIDNCFVSGITPTEKGFILNLNDVKVMKNKVLFKEYWHDN